MVNNKVTKARKSTKRAAPKNKAKTTKTAKTAKASNITKPEYDWKNNHFYLFLAQLFWVIVCTMLNVLIVLSLATSLFGTETRYIADYMPGPMVSNVNKPWGQEVLEQLRIDLVLPFFASLLLVGFEAFVLYRFKIFRKNWLMAGWILLMVIIPLIPAATQIASLYKFTS